MESIAVVRSKFEVLRTFEDVAKFDAWAEVQMAQIDDETLKLATLEQQCVREAEEEKTRLQGLGWFRRLFASKTELRKREAAVQQKQRALQACAHYQDELAEMVEFTPDNAAEQKALLKQLRLQKKELQAQKKELSADMRAIRQQHRTASAEAGRFMGGFIYDRKIAATTRRELRVSREAQLRPHENMKESIDRQIRSVDRRILWTERFGHAEE